MKNSCKYFYLALILTAVIATIGMPVSAFSCGSVPDKGKQSFPDGQISRVAFGAGAKQWQHQTTLASLSSTQKHESSKGIENLTPCTDLRPQVCTQEYRPVCAKRQEGSFKTYSNGCTACTDPAVTGYREGACK